MRGFKPRLPASFGIPVGALSKRAVLKLRGFKLRLPGSFGIPVGTLCKRAVRGCAVSNRVYRVHSAFLTAWGTALSTSLAINPCMPKDAAAMSPAKP